MKQTIIALGLALITVPTVSQAAVKTQSYYCGTDQGEYSVEVSVDDGAVVEMHKDTLLQATHQKKVEPNPEFVNYQMDTSNASDKCSEFLLNNGRKQASNDHTSSDIKGDGSILARVYFDFDHSDLTERSQYVLNTLYKEIKGSKQLLDVIGHADAIGTNEYNYTLGLDRAKAVSAYLRNKGYSSSLLKVLSRGELKPIASNVTDKGRQKNRRVELQ